MTECYIQNAAGPCHCGNCDWKGDAADAGFVAARGRKLTWREAVPHYFVGIREGDYAA